MKVAMLAAGVGRRLGLAEDAPPKALLRFNGESLLKRHLDILAHFGLLDLTLVVGHQASAIEEELGASARASGCAPALGIAPDLALAVALLKRAREVAYGVPGLVDWALTGLAGRRARDGVTGAQAVGRRSTGLPRHS